MEQSLKVVIAILLCLLGCSTGFGEPCEIPRSQNFQQACFDAADPNSEMEESGSNLEQMTVSSCAIQNYAGCSTRTCLVYRGSEPYCSERCAADGDCEGSAVCRPIIGQYSGEGTCMGECYCVRQSDSTR